MAATFNVEKLSARAHARWEETGEAFDEWRHRMGEHLERGREHLPHIDLPGLPTVDELKAKAHGMFARSPAIDDIVLRAREMLRQSVALRLAEPGLLRA